MKYNSYVDPLTKRSQTLMLKSTNASDELFLTALTRVLIESTRSRLTIKFENEGELCFFDTLDDNED